MLTGVAIGATLISVYLTYTIHKMPYEIGSEKTRFHSRLGLALTSLLVGEGLMGCLTVIVQMFYKEFGLIYQIRRAHKCLGYTMLIMGLMNNSYGWQIYSSSGLYYIGLAIILIVTALLEARHQFMYKIPKLLFSIRKLKDVTHKEAFEQINNSKMKLMFYDEYVLNIKHFMGTHPGGAFMLKDAIGEDTGKYMVGCSSVGGNLMPYTHTKMAFDYCKKLAIGKIPFPDGFVKSMENKDFDGKMEMMIQSQTMLNEHTRLLILASDLVKMSIRPLDSFWIGKHFKISAKIKGTKVSRYYSAFFVNLKAWASQFDVSLAKKYPEIPEGAIQIIYKAYPNGKITGHLAGLPDNSKVELKGPFGPGLLLNDYSGNYLGFCGGTGLIPYLDLVYYIWENRNNGLNISLTLFVSFRSLSDSFALELLESTAKQVSQNFKLIQLIDKQGPNLPELIKQNTNENVTGAWVCGPSGYNKFIKDLLVENGLDRNKIVVL